MRVDDPEKRRELVRLIAEYKDAAAAAAAGKRKKKKRRCSCTEGYIRRWENRARSAIMSALARPKPVRLRPWPDPRLETTLPIPVARTSLYGRIPPRIARLAEPKARRAFNAGPADDDDDDDSRTAGRGDSADDDGGRTPRRRPASLARILSLSRPKPAVKRVHRGCADSERPERLYFFRGPRGGRPRGDGRTAPSSAERRTRLKRLARPKRVFRGPPERRARSRTMTRSQVEASANRLSEPPEHRRYARRPQKPRAEPRPFGPLRPLDVDWVKRLSVPRKLSSETRLNLQFDPDAISRSALRAKASKRTEALAEPKFTVKTAVDTEFKENAFSVSPKALTYKATKRIKKLATPRKR